MKSKKKAPMRGTPILPTTEKGAQKKALSIQQYLGVPQSWPVVEKLKHKIVLMPNREDIRTAKRNDPLGCALHNAACRIFDSPSCAIGGRWAYIPQRDENGEWYIARMQAGQKTREAILKFDKTGEIPVGGFEFVPIAPTHFYAAKRKYNKKYHRGEVGGSGKKRTHTKAWYVRRKSPKLIRD